MPGLEHERMSEPRIRRSDEPSVGLAPLLVRRNIDKIKELKEGFDLTVLMAEQNFTQAVRIADRAKLIPCGHRAVGSPWAYWQIVFGSSCGISINSR